MSFNMRAETDPPDIQKNSVLNGRWSGETYRIIQHLGTGANGKVYLVWRRQSRVALKIGVDATAIALEYEHLREIAEKINNAGVVPELFELEDVVVHGVTYPVLVMEWINGVDVEQFVLQRGDLWVAVCLWKIIRLIDTLHQQGFVFCDIKPGNLLFDLQSAEPRLVDFGGVTPIGQAVREFTEMYDRAWWGRGSRKADVAYDTFACAMLGMQLACPISKGELERLQKKSPNERSACLDQRLHTTWKQDDLRIALQPALSGTARLASLRIALAPLLQRTAHPTKTERVAIHDGRLKRRRRFDATDWGLLVSVLAFTLAMCTLWWIGTL